MLQETRSPVIVIIGGGFSGSMVAVHLLKNATNPLTVKLIECKPFVGRGNAYSTNLDCHLLNTPASKMSAFGDRPNHFLDWLQNYAPQYYQNTFVPRKLYGKYIQQILEDTVATARKGVCLEKLTDEAVAIEHDSINARVFLASSRAIAADLVVLALGNFPPAAPPVADSSFYQSDRYINSLWSLRSLSAIDRDRPILLIGSSLTAIDGIVALHQQGHRAKIHVVSRRGLFPQSHQATLPYPSFLKSAQAPKKIRTLVRLIRDEVESARARGYNWRAVIDSVRPETQALWQSLPLKERQRFLRHVQPYWDTHRHRVAPQIAQIINNLERSQQLILHAGRIQAYCEDTEGVDVVISPRGSHESLVLRANIVINCTGPESNYNKIQHPLIVNLLSSGLIRTDTLKLGLDITANGAIIGAEGKVRNWLYTLGSPCKSYLWETTAVAEIRDRSEKLAYNLLNSLTKTTVANTYKQHKLKLLLQ